jgi:hypothetical protein
MNNRTYVYAIYIATTPEQLWQGLTSNEFIQQYWPEWRIESDWQTGSPVTYSDFGMSVQADEPRGTLGTRGKLGVMLLRCTPVLPVVRSS